MTDHIYDIVKDHGERTYRLGLRLGLLIGFCTSGVVGLILFLIFV